MKILVTGGAGFIGSNVVDGYIAAGHQVLVVDKALKGLGWAPRRSLAEGIRQTLEWRRSA